MTGKLDYDRRRRERCPAASLILSDLNDDVVFQSDEQRPQTAQPIQPLSVVGFAGITEFLVGTTESHDDRTAIHTDARFLCLHRLLELWWKSINSGSRKVLFIEIEDWQENLFQLIWTEIAWNLFCKSNDDL